MLTRKDLNGLKFLFRLLKGENKNINYIMKLLKERYAFDDKTAFEIAYLYDKNYQSDGDFTNITDPIRMSYEEYMDLPGEILALMKVLGDNNPEEFEVIESHGSNSVSNKFFEEIMYDGTKYYVYNDWNNIDKELFDSFEWLCEDYGDHLSSYIYMYDSDKRIFASNEADNYVDNMDDDDIIERADLKDKIEILDEIESLQDELDNTDSEDEEEIERIEQEIKDLKDSIDDSTYDELIEESKEKIREAEYDRVYDDLDDPVEYFIGSGYYDSIRELIRSGSVSFDCNQVKRDHIDDIGNDDVAAALGYDWIGEVEIKNDTFYVFSEQ